MQMIQNSNYNATKSEVGQMFPEEGHRIAYTKIETNPCYLLEIKTKEQHSLKV